MQKATSKTRSTFGVKRVIIRTKPGDSSRCLIRVGNITFQGSLGRSGTTIFKYEGDGATPIAKMQILYGFYKDRYRHRPKSKLKMRPIQKQFGWCDDKTHPQYNNLIQKPFSGKHETLLRHDELYDFIIVLDWNINCRKRNRGSAIFFHIAISGYKPTEGCIAISKQNMIRLLPHLSSKTILQVC